MILMATSMDNRGYGRYAIQNPGTGSGDGSIQLRFGGKALASFVDGSVSVVSPEREADRGFIAG